MKRKVSLALGLIVLIISTIISFNAYADTVDISDAVATLEYLTTTYTGSEITPSVTVKLDENTLIKDTDYVLSYSNNINPGTAIVTISGAGDYTGSIEKTFTINAINITNSASVTLNSNSFSYTGNAIKPSVTVKYNDNTLVNGTDYSVSYIDNNKVTNSAKCVVKFKGIYTGSITKSFKIISADVKNLRMKTFSTNSVTLQWDNAPGVDGYRVYRYFPNTNSYLYLGWVNGKTNTYQVKNLTNGYDFWFVVFSYTYHNSQRTSYSFGNDSDIFTCSTAPVKLSFSEIYKNRGDLELKWNKVNSSGYEIWYGLKSDFSDATKVIIRSGHTTSFKASGLDPNRNYYLRIQAYRYNNGKYYFGGFNKAQGTYYCNLYMTYYSKYPDNYNRTTNLLIASNAIDGTIIYPGQLFDFNKIVGPRTVARGYREATIFSGTSSTEQGVGGGICQVASTIFNTALYANVQIVERHQHSQRVTYVPLGRDAAIYGNSQNFVWRNSTPYPIRIIMSVGSNTLRCSFYTPVYVKDPDVSLSVSQSGKNFTMRRYVNGSVNYTCKSNY